MANDLRAAAPSAAAHARRAHLSAGTREGHTTMFR